MSESYFTVEHLSTKDIIRIFSKIRISSEHFYNGTPCWEWIGSRHHQGYGQLNWHKRPTGVHRVMYAWLVKQLPDGRSYIELDHLCLNKPCCNPCHLELVPRRVNTQRYYDLKTHCAQGHPRTPENTLTNPTSGTHGCRLCKNARQRQYEKERRQNPEWANKQNERKRQSRLKKKESA